VSNNKVTKLKPRSKPAALDTPTDLNDAAVKAVSAALNGLLADSYALYLKTKNFHWHVSGPHFRDYHLLFDDQAADILGATDDMAERVRKIGGTTLRSIGIFPSCRPSSRITTRNSCRPPTCCVS
jgi:starvation-inducible DNA-binding protein